MLGINGKPFISLDNLCSLTDQEWQEIYFELCLGLAKSNNAAPHSYYPRDHVYWPHHPDNPTLQADVNLDHLNNKQKILVKMLDFRTLFKFLKYYGGAYFSENQTLFLTKVLDPRTAYDNREDIAGYTEEAKQNFPKTIRMLNDLNIFESIGRVIVWGQDPYQPVITHKDQLGIKAEYFLHINPSKGKLFFVYDEDADIKHYTNENRIIMFNNSDWHGADPQNKFSLTLKVSGKIKAEIVKDLDYRI